MKTSDCNIQCRPINGKNKSKKAQKAHHTHHIWPRIIILCALKTFYKQCGDCQYKRRAVHHNSHASFQQLGNHLIRLFTVSNRWKRRKRLILNQLLKIAAFQHSVNFNAIQTVFHLLHQLWICQTANIS